MDCCKQQPLKEEKKCTSCKKTFPFDKFWNESLKRECKTCQECRDKDRERRKTKCPHVKGRDLKRCLICYPQKKKQCVKCKKDYQPQKINPKLLNICEECRKEGTTFCNVCKKEDFTINFEVERKVLKSCKSCTERIRENRRKNKCTHGKDKSKCRECLGGSICAHNINRYYCKECSNGKAFCHHDKERRYCRECKGNKICPCGKQKNICRHHGGKIFCIHDKNKHFCKKCSGSQICVHNRVRASCKVCDPYGHLKSLTRSRIHRALKGRKEGRTTEYLGCTIEEYRNYIESLWEEGMSWDNYGKYDPQIKRWQIDHTVPLLYEENLCVEEVTKRLHYTNTRPMWALENLEKGNRWIG